MAAGGSLSAVRAGTAMGSATGTAYRFGRDTSGEAGLSGGAAGMGGGAPAGGGADNQGVRSAAEPFRRSAEAGRGAAWVATGGGPISSGHDPAANTSAGAPPAWAKRLRSEQAARSHRESAMQAVRDGDRPGGGANPSLNDKDD